MYAVIRVGTSQERVTEGQVVRVDLRTVTAKIIGNETGPKIRALTYKSKSIQRRRWGHRQHYSTVEITKISPKA
jgi:ribosomal protein L21